MSNQLLSFELELDGVHLLHADDKIGTNYISFVAWCDDLSAVRNRPYFAFIESCHNFMPVRVIS